LEAVERYNGNYGVYQGTMRLEAIQSVPHSVAFEITSTDYEYDDTDESDRAYQGIVPWGDAT
jgi:hypothetical protein